MRDIADYYSNLSQYQDFQQYRCQVDEFMSQINKIASDDAIIGATHEFIRNRQENFVNQPIKEYFLKEINSLLTIFPSNRSDINRLKTVIKILLEQQVERYWYANYPIYENDADVDNDKELYDLAHSQKIKTRINFGFTILREDSFNRLLNPLHRSFRYLLNHPAKKTVGMKTTKCKPATIALLNELTQNINQRINQVKPIKLQVNSILRTVAHQKHLASLGYWAPASTSHTTGYAADIEREWYFHQDSQLFQSIQATLHEYYEKQIINLIDEERVWHICLNPNYVEHYTKIWENSVLKG